MYIAGASQAAITTQGKIRFLGRLDNINKTAGMQGLSHSVSHYERHTQTALPESAHNKMTAGSGHMSLRRVN